MKLYNKILIIIFILLAANIAEAQTFPANIPTGHRRIWWSPQRLSQAQQWFITHPFNPSATTNPVFSSSDPTGNALKYVLTGNAANARVAIDWALNAIDLMPTTGLTCDQCRWYGEEAIIAFDWCYDQMTVDERSRFTSKMNSVVTAFNATTWGNNNPESNYFWGYHRLSLMWGIASYWENTTQANSFINNALQTKWDDQFIPHATDKAPGGMPAEGVDYGGTVESYPVVVLETMKMYGRDLYAETDYFKRSVFANIYSALPDLTYDNPLRMAAGKSWFPYGDSGDFLGAQDPILRSSVKDFMKYAAVRWNDIKIGKYARKWVNWLNSSFPKLYDAADPGGVAEDFTSLPLDYYSTGEVGHAFLRTQWGPQATVVNLQLASPPLIGHEHFDTGNWQIWRNQRFLSRESPGRGQNSGYSYAGYNNVGVAQAEASVNHNVLLFGGRGHASGSDIPSTVGTAIVLRMETTPNYFYSAVDITPSYINSNPDNPSWTNQNISHAEREFIFIRPLETLFIFDRTQSIASANTTKTFLAHFQNQPTLDGMQTYLSVNETQAFRLQTLVPSGLTSANYRLINEQSSKPAETGNPYRLEVEQSGTGVQYFMHVAQARDASGGANVTAAIESETATTYTVTLSHPTKGGVRIILNKGITTSGGSFGFSTSGVPPTTLPLRTTVQGISITDNGPVWAGATTCSYSISQTSVSSGAAASSGSVSVMAGAGCTWNATSNATWLTVTSGTSGTGNANVIYAIAANTGAARTGTINIAGQIFTVNQAAASNCSTTLSSGAWINSGFTAQAGTFTINLDVTPSLSNMDGVIGLSNGAQDSYPGFACLVVFDPSGVIKARNGGTYSATTTVPYTAGNMYHLREVINVTNHTYSIFVTPPGGTELTVGSNFAFRTEQSVVAQLTNWGAATEPSVGTGTLSVCNFTLGATCSYSISSTNVSHASAAATGSVNVNAPAGCDWTATESLSWVTVSGGGQGNGTVTYSITANTGAVRSGTVTIAGQLFTINQAAPASGSLVDYYVNETEPTVTFTGGAGASAIAAEGIGGSNSLKFSNLVTWDKTKRVHYATAKNISSVLSTDILRISVDMAPGAPATYIVIAFNDRWDVTVNTPVIDNVVGFQTFDISLSAVRAALGNTVNDIYFHAGDGFPAGVTLKVDEIRFIRQTGIQQTAARVDEFGRIEEESILSNKVNVYPNPANNEINIELQESLSNPTRLQLIDRLGKTVVAYKLETGAKSLIINTQEFAPGIYMLHVPIPQGVVRKKIMIVHK